MTGRRLYDHYTDAFASTFQQHRAAWAGSADVPLPAWPSLSGARRAAWNDFARRITPKKRRTT